MQTQKLENLLVDKISLSRPPVEQIIEALTKDLAKKYIQVSVKYVDCPDLCQPPFNLAAKGLSGNPSVIQFGDPAYVVPNTLKNKLYSFKDIPNVLNMDSCFIIGAGGGCWPAFGHFSEMFANVIVNENEFCNYSREIFTTNEACSGILVKESDIHESRFACLGNLFVCRGEPGKVIHVVCRHGKHGNGDFPGMINASLKSAFDDPVALGGIVRMISGKAEHHVAPTFAKEITNTKRLMNEWLLLSDISAPFISAGTLLTKNPPDWNMVNQHFHSFNEDNEGGHYHFDVNSKRASYEAYLMVAETLCAVDKAAKAVNIFDY